MSPDQIPSQPRHVLSRRGLSVAGITAAAAAVFVVITGIATRASADKRLTEWTDAQAVPMVSVTTPGGGGSLSSLDLPGRLEAYSRAPIYARVSGYLKYWKADIGAHVKAGQLLAEIEVPDQDQQLEQAKASLASAEASASLAESTAQRWQAILESHAVSQQTVDEKVGDLATKRALANAARANVARLEALERFKRIVAPFDGIVTARDTDVGALINAGVGTGPQLFVVSDIRKLRVYVSVPQNYVPQIKAGTTAQISVPERPGRTFPATLEASAQAVDPQSGATLMQLAVDNRANELLPGGFATVRFALPGEASALSVPASALIFDKDGLRVATVDTDGHVTLKPVTVARDLGKLIEVSAGLAANDRVIETPPDGLVTGDLVRVAASTDGGALAAAPPVRPAGGRSYGGK